MTCEHVDKARYVNGDNQYDVCLVCGALFLPPGHLKEFRRIEGLRRKFVPADLVKVLKGD
jgi:hypothetical protein